MSNDSGSTERCRNLWAPWRMEYIDALNEPGDGCFLCRYAAEPENDAKHLVLWRGRRCFALLNRFPYTGGHSMIAPYEHVPELADLNGETMLEIMRFLRDTQKIMRESLHPDGFNIGINVGQPAGAGLPGHLHVHIVPRWSGDTNFITVFGGVRVIPQSLESLYSLLRKTAEQLHLPDLEADKLK